ncbi:MAG TPA: family 1 glycosylhydrolase [Flavisolibacter sp.]|nr:family 1 glycosylhydrolase [Flavisolibacter sp.]
MNNGNEIQVWGGIECTINRVGDQYFDQSLYSDHYSRGCADLDLVASLGISMLRYPILWERHQPEPGMEIDWSFTAQSLEQLGKNNILPIAGLVHHGSGPRHVNFFDGSFEQGLANYAQQVASRFPWLEYYTPVNEPLTTARFCGLYGHWYPHGKDDHSFYKVLLAECKATVMAMEAIRKINPEAKLIQTEDLSKCYSTPLLAYQADMENHRRWLSYDLLCGRVDQGHYMWKWLVKAGITEEEILYFLDHHCIPHIAGFNYYITSERFLDEDLSKYPSQYHGGNYRHRYADIETVKVPMHQENGPALLLKEAWQHLQIPLAITECHLHSTREDQMRWFHTMWKTVNKVKREGVDVRAITAWAIFGLYGWNCLVTKPCGDYEPGVFNLSPGYPRPTALARLLQELTRNKAYHHPVLDREGWWQRDNRQQFGSPKVVSMKKKKTSTSCRPLLILGKTGTLGKAFGQVCEERNIHHLMLRRCDLDITDPAGFEKLIHDLDPWGVVNAAGYVKPDEAENDEQACFLANTQGPVSLARICSDKNTRFLSYSSDLVFDGRKASAYTEQDAPNPLSVYGRSKAMAEEQILANNEQALVIRSSSFFGPWDNANFVAATLSSLREGRRVEAARDVLMSPTYVPDLVHTSIDLLLDGDAGIYHVTNGETVSWAQFARWIAITAGYDPALVKPVPYHSMGWKARRPRFSAMQSTKGIKLQSLSRALECCLEALGHAYHSGRIAV